MLTAGVLGVCIWVFSQWDSAVVRALFSAILFGALATTLGLMLNTLAKDYSQKLAQAEEKERETHAARASVRQEAKALIADLKRRYRILDEEPESEHLPWGLRDYAEILKTKGDEETRYRDVSKRDGFQEALGDIGADGLWLVPFWTKGNRFLDELKEAKRKQDNKPAAPPPPPPKKKTVIELIEEELGVIETLAELEKRGSQAMQKHPGMADHIQTILEDLAYRIKSGERR